METKEIEYNGFKVVQNMDIDRIQLFFEQRPTPETITKLKRAAFKWAPSQQAWQRQITSNAISVTKQLIPTLQ